ncbi:MAG: hypothetical protein ACXW2B_09780, partial [Methylomagnum sp.]
GGFEYAIAVLSERNWRKDGRIDDPADARNVSAELAFQIVKRWAELKWPNAAPPQPAPAVKPTTPVKRLTATTGTAAKPAATPGKKAKSKPPTKPVP